MKEEYIKIKCDQCLNSRPIISENGIHYICCFSDKKAFACISQQKNYFVEKKGTV